MKKTTETNVIVLRHFQQYFNYIVAVSFIGGGNWNARRKTHMLEYVGQSEINVRENGRRSPEWTIQRPLQNCARNTQDEGKRNKKHNAESWTPLYR